MIQNQLEIFKKILKSIHNNGVMNLSVVIIYSIVDSIIHAFCSSFRPVDPKRRVSTIIDRFGSAKNV